MDPVRDARRPTDWLERLMAACERAQADLSDHDERHTADLRAAIDDLRARIID